jgi:hypothetical protein
MVLLLQYFCPINLILFCIFLNECTPQGKFALYLLIGRSFLQVKTIWKLIYVWGSSMSIVTRLWAGQLGFNSQQGKEGILFFCHHVQTGSRAHPASYPMCIEGFFPGDKVAEA